MVFDLQDFALDGDFIRMRAADDLAGCGSILSALAELKERPPAGDVYGVFTRAEEIGLMGARLMAEAGSLPPDTLVVSTESSRTLPGAEQGSGPVIRVGDAGYTFNVEAESVLIRAREVLQGRPDGFKCQRQLMSGGVCEASAFSVYGYQATGIAFPLGNYHNAAPEGRIEAEYIHLQDYLGGVELMVEAAHSVADRGQYRVQGPAAPRTGGDPPAAHGTPRVAYNPETLNAKFPFELGQPRRPPPGLGRDGGGGLGTFAGQGSGLSLVSLLRELRIEHIVCFPGYSFV